MTNAEGTFDLEIPSALSNAILTVSPPGFALRAYNAPFDGRDLVFNVPDAGGTLRIRIPRDAHALFVEQDGKPLPLPDLLHWAGARSIPTAANNTWDIVNLSPAHYRVCFATDCSEGDLAALAQLELAPQVH